MATRAEHRRAARAAARHDYQVPIVPGLMPEDTPEWRQVAMDQAHEELPQIPGTKVVLYFFEYLAGLSKLRELYTTTDGNGDAAVALIDGHRIKLGYDPSTAIVTFATRQQHRTH